MYRRCMFLDTLPAFNFNTGLGEYTVIDGKKRGTNTKNLGSTLMSAMLKEVERFCNPEHKADWTSDPHQQVHNTCLC